MTMLTDIGDFHRLFELRYQGPPRQLPKELSDFRVKFLVEELDEYTESVDDLESELKENEPDPEEVTRLLAKQLDALVDLVYVAFGTAYLQGFSIGEAWERVHRANMKKIRTERVEDSKRGSTFDVVKPRGWVPPKLEDLVYHHAHRPMIPVNPHQKDMFNEPS